MRARQSIGVFIVVRVNVFEVNINIPLLTQLYPFNKQFDDDGALGSRPFAVDPRDNVGVVDFYQHALSFKLPKPYRRSNE